MSFFNIFTNRMFMCAVLGWFSAQVIKTILNVVKEQKFDKKRMLGSGGMPSSHTSFTVSLASIIGMNYRFDSAEFALAATLSLIVMYDAAGVRQAAGKQAKLLNEIAEQVLHGGWPNANAKLKELIGHTGKEVFAGAILGIFVAIAFNSTFPG